MALTAQQIAERKTRLKPGQTIDVATGRVFTKELEDLNKQKVGFDDPGKSKVDPGISKATTVAPKAPTKPIFEERGESFRLAALPEEEQARIREESAKLAEVKTRGEELMEKLGETQEVEKTAFEERVGLETSLAEKRRGITSEALIRGEAGAQAALIPGREGVVSGLNIAAARGFTRGVQNQLDILDTQKSLFDKDIATKRQEFDKLLELEQFDAAQAISNQISNIEAQKNQLDFQKVGLQREAGEAMTKSIIEDFGVELGSATDEVLWKVSGQDEDIFNRLINNRDRIKTEGLAAQEKAKAERQNTSFDNFNNLDSEQVAQIGAVQAKQWDSAMGLPGGSTAQFVLGTQNALKLKEEEQRLAFAELRADIDSKRAERVIKEREVSLKEFEAGIGDVQINPQTVQTSLQSGDMINFKGKTNADGSVITRPSIEGSETAEIGDGNIVLGSDWVWGLDIDGRDGDDILAPSVIDGGSILSIDKEGKGGFGVNIKVKDNMGRIWQFGHLKKGSIGDLKVGQQIARGMNIGQIGNTGTVHPEPKAGDLESGSHVDITVTEGGKNIAADQTEALINAGKVNARRLGTEQFKQFQNFRDDFAGNPQVKSFEKASVESLNLLDSLGEVTGPGDMAAIFQFMKTLDPTSVVRESEFALAESAAGVIPRGLNFYDKISKGELIPDQETRDDFSNIAAKLIRNRADQYDQIWNNTAAKMKIQGISGTFYPNNEAQRLKIKLIEKLGVNTPTNQTGKTNQDILDEAQGDVTNEDFYGPVAPTVGPIAPTDLQTQTITG